MKKTKFIIPIILVIAAFGFVVYEGELQETRLLFVGDMMFDRTIRSRVAEGGFDHLFSCVSETLKQYDVVVGNLEGPITSNSSVTLGTVPGDINNMRFTFPKDTAKALHKNNIKVVTIANNHIFDFGKAGVESTRQALTKERVGWLGDPLDKSHKTYVYKSGSHSVALVGFNQFLGVDSVEKTAEEIKKYKKEGDIVVAFSHWGEEYVGATGSQKAWAHKFVDAGADLVIGSHPHVIQEIETYKNKKIYYSLGNFIFDQWWNVSVRHSMGVELVIQGDTIETSEIYFESSRDGRTCLTSTDS